MKYPALYIYKKTSDKGRELRYSIRSLPNLTNWNGEVYIVGHAEDWLQNATVIDAPKFATRSDDVQSKYWTIATHKNTPDDFILMNDDFFITRVVEVKPLHQGKLSDQPTNSAWLRTKHRTRQYLENMGISEPKDYDIHVPMIMNKQKLAEVLKHHEGRKPSSHLMTRTLYGNLHKVGGKNIKDPKTRTNDLIDYDFTSTTMFNDKLSKLFPSASPFEKQGGTMQVTPIKHPDGTETVTLWGKTFDVTRKKKLTAFKRDFKIVRRKAKATKVDIEVTQDSKEETVEVANGKK